MSRRSRTIPGQFAPRLIEMLESVAYRALSLSARRVIERIEIELGHHGGKDNGKLPVTTTDFERFGIERKTIPSAIREAQALGFIEITQRGYGGSADSRRPSLYRLTFREAKGYPGYGTHEWRSVVNDPSKTDAENLAKALQIAKDARAAKDEFAVKRGIRAFQKSKAKAEAKKQNFGWGKSQISGGENPPENGSPPRGENPPTGSGGENPPTIDISDEDAAEIPAPPLPPTRRKLSRHRRQSASAAKARAVPS